MNDQERGAEAYHQRKNEVREVVERYTADEAWDNLQARDLDPKLTTVVEEMLQKGFSPGEICNQLRMKGGTQGKAWKKLQAYFRQGFRADAEVYLMRATHKYYKVMDKALEVLEDAFENGTPVLTEIKGEKGATLGHDVIRVKGATRELASFLKAYSDSVRLPVQLWRDFGAIGEKKDVGPGGVTIVVQNNIPMPTSEEIEAHQKTLIIRGEKVAEKLSGPLE